MLSVPVWARTESQLAVPEHTFPAGEQHEKQFSHGEGVSGLEEEKVTVPEALAQSRPFVYAAFALIYAIPTLLVAHGKILWDDEFFTLYLSRVASWHDLLRALRTGADQHPPSFYYLTHLVLALFGSGHITVRLPEILGFAMLCLCLYEAARMMLPPLWAVVAMCFPLTTSLYYYATEARAYGLVCGFAGLALLAYMRATSPPRRLGPLFLLAFASAAAVGSHYYAVMLLLCLGLAEGVRTISRRKVNLSIWAALACGLLPVLVFRDVIHSARGYSNHFWAVPVWTDSLRFYAQEVAFGVCGLVITVALAYSSGRRFWRVPEPVRPSQPMPLPWAVAIGSLTLLPFAVLVLAKFVTHGFSDRYAISAIVGVGLLVPWILGRSFPQRNIALAALAASMLLFWFQVHDLRERYYDIRVWVQKDIAFLNTQSKEPIVMAEVTRFHRVSFYAPRELVSRLTFVANPTSSVEYLGQDTVDRGLLDLREWFPLHVEGTERYLAEHADFLIFGNVSSWNWVTFEAAKWGTSDLVARTRTGALLFALHRTGPAPHDGSRPTGPDLVDAMYDHVPATGPSLCKQYFGTRDCF